MAKLYARNKKTARRAVFSLCRLALRSGGDGRNLLTVAAHHEADKAEAQDHHGPSGGLRNRGGNIGKFKGRIPRTENQLVKLFSAREDESESPICIRSKLIAVCKAREQGG